MDKRSLNLGKYAKKGSNGFWLGKKRSQEDKNKMSLAAKNRPSSIGNLGNYANKGHQSAFKGKHFTEEVKEKVIAKLKENTLKFQKSKRPTSIEKAVYDFLLLKGILFERQKQINGKFIVDAFIPSLNLVIEADGSYWHSLDRVQKKDKAENAYLLKCGFNLLRFSEQEIKNGSFKERLVLNNG